MSERPKDPRRRTIWRRRGVVALLACCVLAGGTWGAWQIVRQRAGDPRDALSDRWFEGHLVLDRRGAPLRELVGEHDRRGRPIALTEVGPRLILATLAAEDQSFYEHNGLDRRAILRAVEQGLRNGRFVSGASTITQQLVKLLDTRGIPEPRTAATKLRESARAQNLEREIDKTTILSAYLDRLPYGHGLTGPEAAAQAYFGVPSQNLSWAQASFLAVLPRAPSFLDPYRYPERVVMRQRAVLDLLVEAGTIDEHQHERALAEAIELRPLTHPFGAPHFVDMLLAEHRLDPGTRTSTTLDGGLQSDVEGLTQIHMAKLAERQASDAAAIVIDNATGDVLAYVGSTDFHDPTIAGQVDMARARRQPGSTLKPFVYALAFARGHTPAEMLADVPTEFAELGGDVYAPKNFYDDFIGPISAAEALAASLNVPAVRLAAEFEPGQLLAFLHDLGFESLDEDPAHYGLALALGGGEVELREIAAAYVALARGGTAIPLRFTASTPPSTPRQILEPAVAAAVTDALSDPLARLRLLAGRSPFDLGFPLALKTGTSSGYRDTWTVGYTAERTVAVWVGNADAGPMHAVTGVSGAGPLFADIMRRAMADVDTRAPLFDPDLLDVAEVCPLSGLRPSPACPHAAERRFVPGHTPTGSCDLHRRADPNGDLWSCRDAGSKTIAILPPTFDRWLDGKASHAATLGPFGIAFVAERFTEACREPLPQLGPPTLRISTPEEGSVYWRSHPERDRVEVRAAYDGPLALAPKAVEFIVDGRAYARSAYPFEALLDLPPGDHELYARPADPDLGVLMPGVRIAVR